VLDNNEQCDDGANNGTAGDPCSLTCTTVSQATCGDGSVNQTSEQCDLGSMNGTAGSHCSATCQAQAYTSATWTIKNVAGTNQGCPMGYDTAALYSQAVDSSGNPIGTCATASSTCFIDLFTCTDGAGTSSPLPPGQWLTWLAIESHDGTMTYAQSTSAIVDNSTQDQTFAADIYTDGGYFYWAWSLQGQVSGNPLTCADVPNQNGTEIITTVSGGGMAYDDVFTCSDGAGYTSVLPTGSYTCAFDIINTAMQSIGQGQTQTSKVITAPNGVTNLGTVTIDVTGL
jgi:cysteine-rich repeat protein